MSLCRDPYLQVGLYVPCPSRPIFVYKLRANQLCVTLANIGRSYYRVGGFVVPCAEFRIERTLRFLIRQWHEDVLICYFQILTAFGHEM